MIKFASVFITLSLFPIAAVPKTNPAYIDLDYNCAAEAYGEEVSEELDAEVMKKVKEVLARGEEVFGVKFKEPPVAYGWWSHPRTAGSYHAAGNFVMLHPVYLNRYKEFFIDTVVPHELAHMMVFQLTNSTKHDHDEVWRQMVQKLDFPNITQYHNMVLCLDRRTLKQYFRM